MAQRTPEEKSTMDQVLKLVSQLSPKNQSQLRELLEDQEDIRLAEERLKHPGQHWSHEEIKREVGLGN